MGGMRAVPGFKKKTLSFFTAALMLTYGTSSLFLNANNNPVKAAAGAIWTTSGSCGSPQNVNHYPAGSIIYINGSNFSVQQYAWQISDPGNNGTVWLNGVVTPGANGLFCFAAGTLLSGGPYQAKVNDVKGDNFSIDSPIGSPTATPTQAPTATPTQVPTQAPTATPTQAPTATPTATPSATPTQEPRTEPTATPTEAPLATPTPIGQILGDETTDVCANIDGIQTGVPNGLHLDASGRNCVDFSQSGGGDNGGGGQVLGASTTAGGQVLGSSTLGATGGDSRQYLAYVTIILGGLLAVTSFYQFRVELFGNE